MERKPVREQRVYYVLNHEFEHVMEHSFMT